MSALLWLLLISRIPLIITDENLKRGLDIIEEALRDDIVHHFAVNIGQPEITSAIAVSELGVIQAE